MIVPSGFGQALIACISLYWPALLLLHLGGYDDDDGDVVVELRTARNANLDALCLLGRRSRCWFPLAGRLASRLAGNERETLASDSHRRAKSTMND